MSGTRNALESNLVRFDPAPVRHLVLDLCGVLYDDTEWKRWLFGLLTRMGLRTGYSLLFQVWEREFQRDVWRGRREFWSAFRDFLLAAGLTKAQVDEVVAATRPKLRACGGRTRPFAGVRHTLGNLSASGIEVMIVSRHPQTTAEMTDRLRRLGLEAYEENIVATHDADHFGDAGRYFQWLLSRQRCSPRSTAFVGRERDDLLAAGKAGLLTIAFNHDSDARAHLYLDQFDQLASVLRVGDQELLAAG